jgi:UDP-glucose 4-epimerase
MRIYITGIAGYIGGSFATKMLKNGYTVFGCDNFSNSDNSGISALSKNFPNNFHFDELDIRNGNALLNSLKYSDADCVVHFAALKNISESEKNRKLYTENNVEGTKTLLSSMREAKIKSLIFSSSAAVYGNQAKQPIKEDAEPNPISHYAWTKMICENLIKNESRKWLKAIILRYFNPLGIHKEQFFYEKLDNKPRNVMGNIIACYLGIEPFFHIYGNNYPTKDGSAIRDYIHIDDLVDGHISALSFLDNGAKSEIFNLGTSVGKSVFELVEAFNQVSKKKLPVKISERRESDLSISYADSRKLNKICNWKASKSLTEMCESSIKVYDQQ